jgi:SAM domain (Sterile alpha motif)
VQSAATRPPNQKLVYSNGS